MILNSQINLSDFIMPEPKASSKTSGIKSLIGRQYTPKQHLLLISADDWEEFLCEWACTLKERYRSVVRLGGANDFGVDVGCFFTESGFNGEWQNYQCKYYKGEALGRQTAFQEIGKFIWHIFKKNITSPSAYYFFAPKDCGPALKKLLLETNKLKTEVKNKWESWCANSITSTQSIRMVGDFELFFDNFDFQIFKYMPIDKVIEEHKNSPYHISRFGGGLPDRPDPLNPPESISKSESRYVAQLKDAYSEHLNIPFNSLDLNNLPRFLGHFNRQREAFYSAESLRTFARDSLPPGTYEDLKNEMYNSIVEIAEDEHPDGYQRLRKVLDESKRAPLNSNELMHVTKVNDRYGICHQLANEDRLFWVIK